MVDETEGTEQVLSLASERFERRLAQEASALRVELAHLGEGLRQELHEGLGAVRREIADMRVELLKWSFLFWIGQVAAMAGLLSFPLRGAGH